MKFNRLSERSKIALWLGLITAIGIGLRVYRLGFASLWFDELCTAVRSSYPIAQAVASLREAPFPPGYYVLMHGWTLLFGNSEFALRLPSAIFSAATIVAVFLFTRRFVTRRSALVAAFLVSISAYSIYYAQEAKMYSMVWFFGVISFYYFCAMVIRRDRRDVWLYIAASVCMVYVSYTGFLFLLIQSVVVAVSGWGRDKRGKWLGSLGIILVCFLPWFWMAIVQLFSRSGTDWIPRPQGYWQVLFTTLIPRIAGGLIRPANGWISAIVIVFAIAGFAGFLRIRMDSNIKERNFLPIVLGAWIFVPVVAYAVGHLFSFSLLCEWTDRFLGFIYIPLCIAAGWGIYSMLPMLRAGVLVGFAVVSFVFQIVPLYGFSYRYIHGDDFRGVQGKITACVGSRAVVLTDLPRFLPGPEIVRYYNHLEQVQPVEYWKTIEQMPLPLRPDEIVLLYRGPLSKDAAVVEREFSGYAVIEAYFKFPNGFIVLRKS
jgi:uncharacterized membrane protein